MNTYRGDRMDECYIDSVTFFYHEWEEFWQNK